MIVQIPNPDVTSNAVAYLSVASTAGASVLSVRNNSDFAATDFVQAGILGEDTSEIKNISSVTGGTGITLSTAFTFSHQLDTPLYKTYYDKLVISRSTAGTTGSFTPLATVSITPDRLVTEYNDPNFNTGYAYFARFLNSVTTNLSDPSATVTSSPSYAYNTMRYMEDRVVSLFNDPDEVFLKRSEIDDWLNEFYEITQIKIAELDEAFLMTQATLTTNGTGVADMSTLTPGVKFVKRVWISYDNGANWREGFHQYMQQEFPAEVFSVTYPYYTFIGDTIQVRPSQSALVWMHYEQYPNTLSGDNAVPIRPISSLTTAFVNYALGKAYQKQKLFQVASDFIDRADERRDALLASFAQRQKDKPKFMMYTDPDGVTETDDVVLWW